MIMSITEISLQEINEEINQIIKGYTENDTSYFPDSEKLLEAFESYIDCLDLCGELKERKIITQSDCYLFREEIRMHSMPRFSKFVNLLMDWDFGFRDQFRWIMSEKQIFPNKQSQKLLNQVSIVEIIFLMYLCLEIERKQIIGKGFKNGQNRMFLLKEIIKILDEFSQQHHIDSFNSFAINEEKLLKIILLRTLKLKLQKENFSFGMNLKKEESLQNHSLKNSSKKFQQTLSQKVEEIEKNFSLVSVQSEFQQSQIFEEKVEKMKQSLAVLPLKMNTQKFGFEMKNLTNEEIFHEISLSQLRNYISQ